MSAWRMRQLRAASGSTGRSCIEPSASSWKVISTRSSTRSRAPAPRASCRARNKRCLWRRRARVHPKGAPRRTIELLAGEMVRLTDHDDLSRETVLRRLAENELKPWRQTMWCVPAVNGACVDRMEDVIDLRSEEHTSELQSLMRLSYAVFCLQN